MLANPLATLLGILALVLTVWFFVGMQWNIRRGTQIMRWLQEGLPVLAEKTTMRWIGTSSIILDMDHPRSPFRSIELVIFLEPRDVVPLWLWSRWNGRRDLIVMRGNLPRSPRFQADIVNRRSWGGRHLKLPAEWQPFELAGPGLIAAGETEAVNRELGRFYEEIRQIGPELWYASVQRIQPHLELQFPIASLQVRPAAEIFTAFRNLVNFIKPA